MKFKVYHEFEVEEFSAANMDYVVRVYHMGKLVDEFRRPTMKEALLALDYAGYKQGELLEYSDAWL